MTSTVVPVDTPQGPGRLFVDLAEQPSSILVLGHGAGGGVAAADLELLAQHLPAIGTSVVRFEQPWRTAGRKVGAPPPKLDEAWCAALGWLVGPGVGANISSWWAVEVPALEWHAGRRRHRSGGDRVPGIPVASSWSAGEVPGRGAVGTHRAQAGPARQQRQLRHPGGDPRGRSAMRRVSRLWSCPGLTTATGSRSDPWRAHSEHRQRNLPAHPADLRTTLVAEVSRFIGSCSGNIDIMTALHITCPCWWTAGTSSRCCAPRHYSRT